jgi:digeranylgeranylglycerophospholipid reductase
MSITCDVLVVGGGPAGSSAARASAINGANTILIEKKEKIEQVSCAEGVGSYLFPLLPFKIPKNQLIWRIDGISFSDGKTEIIQKGHFYRGWSLDRENFDNWLLNTAKDNGSQIIMDAELTDLKFSTDYNVKEVTIRKGKTSKIIKPKIVIAADGVESNVAKKLGIFQKTTEGIGYVHSWEMKDVKLKHKHIEQMYFGDFAPGVYAYVFPKSENIANIGVGSSKGKKNIEKFFEEFVNDIIKSQTKNAIKTIDRSGEAPIKYCIEKIRYGNVLFTGDAANQNLKPYAEGILPSIICGDIAGKTASRKDILSYEKLIKRKLGNQFTQSDEILNKMYDFDSLSKEKRYLITLYLFAFMDIEGTDRLRDKTVIDIRDEILRKSRHVNSFISMLQYFIWYAKVLATHRD